MNNTPQSFWYEDNLYHLGNNLIGDLHGAYSRHGKKSCFRLPDGRYLRPVWPAPPTDFHELTFEEIQEAEGKVYNVGLISNP